MKLKLFVIKNLEPVLGKIAKQDMNIQMAYRIGKLIQTLGSELKNIEEHRINLIKKYGTPQEEDNNNYEVLSENKENFVKEYEELLNTEIDIIIEEMSIDDFEGITLSPLDSIALSSILI